MAAVSRDYRFAAEPRAIDNRNSKYREYIEEIPPANIMHDRRVVRGNTYASMIIPASTQQEIERQQARERERAKKSKQPPQSTSIKEVSPENRDLQQDSYPIIEEPKQEPLLEPHGDPVANPTQTQVEFFIDRPPTPLFIPNEEGIDVDTQIEDGELFQFDEEVDPILEVIVGKCLEHARMEVLEEYEIELMRKHKRIFTQKRNAELIEVQRMEAEFIRREQEDNRRKLQARTQRELKKAAHQKYICRISSKRLFSNIRFDVCKRLQDLGVFKNPQNTTMHDQFMPWLLESLQGNLVRQVTVSDMLETVFKQTHRELSRQHNEAVTVEYARKEQIKQEEIRKRKENEVRKQKRNEMRAKRQAERERIALKNKIEEEILNTGSHVDGVTKQPLSDSDGRYNEHVICSPGGQIGELLMFLSSIEETLETELNQEQVTGYLINYITHGMNCPALVYANLRQPAIEKLNELVQEGIPTEYEETVRFYMEYLMNTENSVPRTSLTILWNNPESFGIRYGLVEAFLYAYFTIVFAKEDNPQMFALKEKAVIKGLNWADMGREAAIVRIKIPMKREEHDDEEPSVVSEIPDDQLLDKILMVAPSNENFSVLVVHQIGQKFFRNEMMNWIKATRIIETIDYDRLKAVFLTKCMDFEEKIISIKADGLPEYEFEIN